MTNQDQSTIILLDFNGSFDEFRISLSSFSLHRLNNPHNLNEMIHQKHRFPQKYSPPDVKFALMFLLINKERHLIERIKCNVSVETPSFGSWFRDFKFQMRMCITFFYLESYQCLKNVQFYIVFSQILNKLFFRLLCLLSLLLSDWKHL